MPTYLCHGFRWQRRSIRVYVVVQDLDDASPEWIIPAASSQCLLESFYNLFEFLPYCAPPDNGTDYELTPPTEPSPSVDDEIHAYAAAAQRGDGRVRSRSITQGGQRQTSFSSPQARSRSRSRSFSNNQSNGHGKLPPAAVPQSLEGSDGQDAREDDIRAQDWSIVKLLEEFDPMDLSEVSRPYAYVADHVVRVDLSASIFDEIQRYEERLRGDQDPPIIGPSHETSRKKSGKKQGWLEKLRDQLQRDEDIKWYMVVNGDEVRDFRDETLSKVPSGTRSNPTPQQQENHSLYSHQQRIFEDMDRVQASGGAEQRVYPVLRRLDIKPAVPAKDLPAALKTKKSIEAGGLRPKTPSRAGFRRLFGSAKNKPNTLSP